jgi:hypothetical protein
LNDYESRFNGGRRLKGAATPMWVREEQEGGPKEAAGLEKEETTPVAVPASIPHLGSFADELLGKVGWLGRGSRLDFVETGNRLAGRISKWERQDDWALHRLFCYMRSHDAMGILMTGHPHDLASILVRLKTDADQGSDPATVRSTSGCSTALQGPRSYIPAYWLARKQTVTGISTGDTELTSLRDGVYTDALPLVGTMEWLTRRPVRCIASTDTAVGISAVKRGYSRKMAYLRKTQRISLACLHGLFFGEAEDLEPEDCRTIHRLFHQAGSENDADVLTKALPVEKHYKCIEGLGMVPIPVSRL